MDTYTTTIYAANAFPDSGEIDLTHSRELTINGIGAQRNRLIGVSIPTTERDKIADAELHPVTAELLILDSDGGKTFALQICNDTPLKFDSLDAMATYCTAIYDRYNLIEITADTDILEIAREALYWKGIESEVRAFRDCWKYVANLDVGGRKGYRAS